MVEMSGQVKLLGMNVPTFNNYGSFTVLSFELQSDCAIALT